MRGHAVPLAEAVAVVRRLVDGRVRQRCGDRYLVTFNAVGAAGLSGGAVDDAIVRATAREHSATLLTLDRRAQSTSMAIGAAHTLLGSAE